MGQHEQPNGFSAGFDEQAAREAFLVAERLRSQMLDNFLKTQEGIGRLPDEQQREQLQRAWGGSWQ